MITPSDLVRLKALCDGATKGPWRLIDDTCSQCIREGTSEWIIDGPEGARHGQFGKAADAAFIAASREALPALIARVEKLEKALRDKPLEAETLAERLHQVARDHR